MDLRQVRTFLAVVDLGEPVGQVGTVSKAAEHLHITQPALSRQIANLQNELGLKLFDRVGRRLLLTTEGGQLLNNCRALLNSARGIREQAEGLRRGDAGILRVSASPHLIEGLFPEFLRNYAKRYPNVQVRLIDMVGPQMFKMLEEGETHLAQAVAHAVTPDINNAGDTIVYVSTDDSPNFINGVLSAIA